MDIRDELGVGDLGLLLGDCLNTGLLDGGTFNMVRRVRFGVELFVFLGVMTV